MVLINLEAAPIGSLLFMFADSPNDRIGPSSPVGTFATRLLAQALSKAGNEGKCRVCRVSEREGDHDETVGARRLS